MEDSFDAIQSPTRTWTQHQAPAQQLHHRQHSNASGLGSPRAPLQPGTPYSARRTLTLAVSPSPQMATITAPSNPSTPTMPAMGLQLAQSSLLALEARSGARDNGQNAHSHGHYHQHSQYYQQRPKQPQMQHLRLDIASEDKWRRLGARVLPVFNGDGVVGTVEENAEIVRGCLRSEADAAWPEVHSVLRVGMASLVRSLYAHLGMAPTFEPPTPPASAPVVSSSGNLGERFMMNGRLAGSMPLAAVLSINGIAAHDHLSPNALVGALAAVWATMFSHALPYLEGVFLPMAQFASTSISATSSTPRTPTISTTTTTPITTRPPPAAGTTMRHVALVHFRDAIAAPLLGKLDEAVVLARTQGAGGCLGDPWAYYQNLSAILHMLTVLVMLAPGERGHLYDTARALSLALQA
ncbi:hypothetical protein H4217_006351 [Coemansia sp. RSA 1939]|nr:hypothetical protein H4217_006351 [Coemansia sp. RSA 1939]KAJ2691915.1 hypothetical protein GGH99_002074 [Coemansia sp. RSA 1285]